MNLLYAEIDRLKIALDKKDEDLSLALHTCGIKDKIIESNLKPIREAWKRFKHLDHLLSDKTWIQGDDPSPMRLCLYDLWQAIKAAK